MRVRRFDAQGRAWIYATLAVTEPKPCNRLWAWWKRLEPDEVSYVCDR